MASKGLKFNRREGDDEGAFMTEKACIRVHKDLTDAIEKDSTELHSQTSLLFKKADWIVGGVFVAAGSALGLLVTAIVYLSLHGGFAPNESVAKLRNEMVTQIAQVSEKLSVIDTKLSAHEKISADNNKLLEALKESDIFRTKGEKKLRDDKKAEGGRK